LAPFASTGIDGRICEIVISFTTVNHALSTRRPIRPTPAADSRRGVTRLLQLDMYFAMWLSLPLDEP